MPSRERKGPTVVFTMGDPHGIGPEVVLKALHETLPRRAYRPLLFADPNYMRRLARQLGLSLPEELEIRPVGEAAYPPPWGRVDGRAGETAWQSLREAVSYCRSHPGAALVTAPIHKQACRLAGFSYPGQTEFISSFFPGREGVMAFFSDSLKVALASVHVPLRQVFAELTPPRLMRTVSVFHRALLGLGLSSPRIAVCGLNPHASEGGMFGDEESRLLGPVLQELRKGIQTGELLGPLPADTVFQRALSGEFDGVVALYHDQGLIPVKLVAFHRAVNVTLGLPLVRTSPDHGTAFEIAGRGRADPGSMVAAVEWALKLLATGESAGPPG